MRYLFVLDSVRAFFFFFFFRLAAKLIVFEQQSKDFADGKSIKAIKALKKRDKMYSKPPKIRKQQQQTINFVPTVVERHMIAMRALLVYQSVKIAK